MTFRRQARRMGVSGEGQTLCVQEGLGIEEVEEDCSAASPGEEEL